MSLSLIEATLQRIHMYTKYNWWMSEAKQWNWWLVSADEFEPDGTNKKNRETSRKMTEELQLHFDNHFTTRLYDATINFVSFASQASPCPAMGTTSSKKQWRINKKEFEPIQSHYYLLPSKSWRCRTGSQLAMIFVGARIAGMNWFLFDSFVKNSSSVLRQAPATSSASATMSDDNKDISKWKWFNSDVSST